MSVAWSWDRSTKTQKGVASRGRSTNQGQTGYSYSIKGGPAPSRPPREFLESQSYETTAAMRQAHPPPRNPNNSYRSSSFRPASSVYSQPSPVSNNFSSAGSGANYHHGAAPDDISPPSSPEPSYTTSGGYGVPRGRSRDVSPIDEDLSAMTISHGTSRNARNNMEAQQSDGAAQSRSNIPSLRRARRKQSDAALREATQRQGQQKGDVRWDTMTGEPTNSATGKSSQVKPAEFARGLGISASSAPTQKSPPSAITSFGDKVRRMAQSGRADKKPDTVEHGIDPAAGAFTSSRPGWRGASGRTALVEPVRDNPEVTPLKIPRKSSKRVTSPPLAAGPGKPGLFSGTPVSGHAAPVGPSGAETAAHSVPPRETVRRVVPSSQMSFPPNSQPQSSAPSESAISSTSIAAQEATRGRQQGIRRKPPPAHGNHHHSHQESGSSVYTQDPHAPIPPPHAANPTSTGPVDPWTQPASRFSVTTYATSAAATPRESLDVFDHDRPPMPTPPQQYHSSPQPKQDSVMDRRRPKLTESDDDKVYPSSGAPVFVSIKDSFMTSPFSSSSTAARERKAAATGTSTGSSRPEPAAVSWARTAGERPVSTASSINKMLPPAPPEATAEESRDRVGMLNAQLQSLGNRRINLLRSVKQMTELMPQDNVLDSAEVVHKRGLERRKVEALRLELADVQREEYELGLKLHRAYKRMDRDEQYENSALWVRRVTS